jgi:regulator of nonsense transcripts 2
LEEAAKAFQLAVSQDQKTAEADKAVEVDDHSSGPDSDDENADADDNDHDGEGEYDTASEEEEIEVMGRTSLHTGIELTPYV